MDCNKNSASKRAYHSSQYIMILTLEKNVYKNSFFTPFLKGKLIIFLKFVLAHLHLHDLLCTPSVLANKTEISVESIGFCYNKNHYCLVLIIYTGTSVIILLLLFIYKPKYGITKLIKNMGMYS